MSNAPVLDGYLLRDPKAWHDFPHSSEDELARHYSFSRGEGLAVRGLDRVEYRFRALARPGFILPFLFHFDGDQLAFIEAEFWSLDAAICAETVSALGPPPQRLDGWFRDSLVASGERLYPARGIALCVIPETGFIARWTAFAPMSPDTYRRTIQITRPAREFEDRP